MSIVISIKPKWVDLIASGQKQYELRRRPPPIKAPTQCYIYESSPRKRIAYKCIFDVALCAQIPQLWSKVGRESCVTQNEFEAYFKGNLNAYAIPIKDVSKLENPITLTELKRSFGFHPPQSWRYMPQELTAALR